MSAIFRFAKASHVEAKPHPENVEDPLNFINFNNFNNMINKYVHSKHWEQYYTAHNLYFALTREVSDLSGIYQWKNTNELYTKDVVANGNTLRIPYHSHITNNQQYLSLEEYVSLGDEICDIFVYTTRLCYVFQIDIAYTINKMLLHIHTDYANILTQLFRPDEHVRATNWTELSFDSVYHQLEVHAHYIDRESSKRTILHQISQHVNEINSILMSKNEFQCTPIKIMDKDTWCYSDISTIADSLAYIFLNLFTLLVCVNHHCVIYKAKVREGDHIVLELCTNRMSMKDILQLKSVEHTTTKSV